MTALAPQTTAPARHALLYARPLPQVLLFRVAQAHPPAHARRRASQTASQYLELDLQPLHQVELAHTHHSGSNSSGNLDNFLRTLDPVVFAREVLRFRPDAIQAAFLRSTHPRVILNCTRQWGKSTVTAALVTHRVLCGPPDALCVVVSPSQRQSTELLKKIQRFASLAGFPSRARKPVDLHFPRGSRIVGLPANEETIRGYSAPALIIVDEAAKVPANIFPAIRPMLATSGGHLPDCPNANPPASPGSPAPFCACPPPARQILLSTPSGRHGLFYDIWTTGAAADWERYAIPATECARIPAAFLEEERLFHGDLFFRQEYLCEFIDPQGQTFPSVLIAESISDEVDIL